MKAYRSYNFRNYLSYPWALIVELPIFSIGMEGSKQESVSNAKGVLEDRHSLQLISDKDIVITGWCFLWMVEGKMTNYTLNDL